MPKSFFTFFLLSLIALSAKSQNGDYAVGARSDAQAGASVTLEDEWALFNNIGALSYVEEYNAFATYQNRYGLSELSVMAFGMAVPIFNGTAGFGFFRFGDDLLNEQRFNLGFSNRFGIVSLGLNIGFYQLNIEGSGTQNALLFDFGGHAKLTEHLFFGAHISNLNQAELSAFTGEKIATIMKTGISYRPSTELKINVEVQKEVEQDAQLKLGLEYALIERVFLRTGIRTKPFESSFGAGFHTGKFKIDYAFINNPDIGDVHELSVSYQLKK